MQMMRFLLRIGQIILYLKTRLFTHCSCSNSNSTAQSWRPTLPSSSFCSRSMRLCHSGSSATQQPFHIRTPRPCSYSCVTWQFWKCSSARSTSSIGGAAPGLSTSIKTRMTISSDRSESRSPHSIRQHSPFPWSAWSWGWRYRRHSWPKGRSN